MERDGKRSHFRLVRVMQTSKLAAPLPNPLPARSSRREGESGRLSSSRPNQMVPAVPGREENGFATGEDFLHARLRPERQAILPLPKGEGGGEGEGTGTRDESVKSFKWWSARVELMTGWVSRSLSPHPVPLPSGEGNRLAALEIFLHARRGPPCGRRFSLPSGEESKFSVSRHFPSRLKPDHSVNSSKAEGACPLSRGRGIG
jgi:hypothetical protein